MLTSIGGPTAQPAAKKQLVSIAAPAKSSQKIRREWERTAVTSNHHESGHGTGRPIGKGESGGGLAISSPGCVAVRDRFAPQDKSHEGCGSCKSGKREETFAAHSEAASGGEYRTQSELLGGMTSLSASDSSSSGRVSHRSGAKRGNEEGEAKGETGGPGENDEERDESQDEEAEEAKAGGEDDAMRSSRSEMIEGKCEESFISVANTRCAKSGESHCDVSARIEA